MNKLDVNKLNIDAVDLWMNKWLLLTVGSMEDCNMMTVAWGGIGCMWGKPVAHVVVRPQRHTYQFIEKYDDFSLCAFPEDYKKDLQVMGSLSGRDGDKVAKTDLSLKGSSVISSPSYNEASFILECRKIYYHDFDPNGFLDDSIDTNYPAKDYHRFYYGEIVAAFQK